jgi:hypothetical protein
MAAIDLLEISKWFRPLYSNFILSISEWKNPLSKLCLLLMFFFNAETTMH